jgi:hypothetical protein
VHDAQAVQVRHSISNLQLHASTSTSTSTKVITAATAPLHRAQEQGCRNQVCNQPRRINAQLQVAGINT